MTRRAPRVVLASASPRRRELLELLGVRFTVRSGDYDEPPPPTHGVHLPAFVTDLATAKAEAAAIHEREAIIIGADTVVAFARGDRGIPIGKPVNEADAQRMLAGLGGRMHSVYTGVAVLRTDRGGVVTHSAARAVRTRVHIRPLDEDAIRRYVGTGEPLDKAGAYAAQGIGAALIDSVDGDFFNVVGLPVRTLADMLHDAGAEPII